MTECFLKESGMGMHEKLKRYEYPIFVLRVAAVGSWQIIGVLIGPALFRRSIVEWAGEVNPIGSDKTMKRNEPIEEKWRRIG